MSLQKQYLDKYFQENTIENLYSLMSGIFEETYALKEVGVHTRVMHSWYTHNLLSYDEKQHHKHRFTLFDVIWIWIIKDLRKFGYPYESIRKAREYLMEPIRLSDILAELPFEGLYKQMNEMYQIGPPYESLSSEQVDFYKDAVHQAKLHYLKTIIPAISFPVLDFIYSRNDWVIMLEQDGEASVKLRESIGLDEDEDYYTKGFIILPLSRYFTKLLRNTRFFPLLHNVEFFGEKEIKLLEKMKEGKLKSVSFHYNKTNEVDRIDVTQISKVDPSARLCELITKGGYEDINIKADDGNIVYGSKTTKIK